MGIDGPVVRVITDKIGIFAVGEIVHVGARAMMGEVISLRSVEGDAIVGHDSAQNGVADKDEAVVQVFEDTTGLYVGEPVHGTGRPLSVRIAPGWVGHVFDGIGRRLDAPGEKKWNVHICVKPGDSLDHHAEWAHVHETEAVIFKAMLPPNICGVVLECAPDGEYSDTEPLLVLQHGDERHVLSLAHFYPVRIPRPICHRLPPERLLTTGVRVVDSLFPVAMGGVAAMPGGFGTGKTMLQHAIAKGCDADLIVYIGCGERGNEMAAVLEDFGTLMSRMVLIANTSDMPVAAREASIFTGLAVAEAYRDMGYNVAVMADSTSRWAEASRELSARLQEIPAEEGYPADLAARLAAFYARAGAVVNVNGTRGSVTLIGAVSPQGVDFSEPVTVYTKRYVRTFWALDKRLAYARHYPAVDWLASYSDYIDLLPPETVRLRARLLDILLEEARIIEIVKLLGSQDLSDAQRDTLRAAKEIREIFLQQNTFDPVDAYTPPQLQAQMMAHYI